MTKYAAQPRFTKDLDIWTDPDPSNAARAYEALRRFGAPLGDLTTSDLARAGTVYQIGVPPNRIDVVTAVDGVAFAEAWPDRRHLVQNRRAARQRRDVSPRR